MATPRNYWLLPGFILVAVLCTGCNVLSIPFFLMMGMDPQREPECRLAAKDREVKVVVLAYSSGVETRPEFIRVDRDLSRLLAQWLQKGFKDNKEKVTLVSPSKVEKFKDDHPNWETMNLEEIARHFEADYVINLEVESLSLYEKGSGNQLYLGRAAIGVSVVDMNQPGEGAIFQKMYTCQYPEVRGPIPVSDKPVQQFRLEFLMYIAKHLSWYFTAHPISEDFARD
jgi:hypothetical protein